MIGVRNWLQIIRIASELLLLKQKQHFLLHPTGEVLTRYKRSYTLSAVPHLSRLLGKMFGLSVTVIFLVIGMSFGQQCNPLGERIVCGNLS